MEKHYVCRYRLYSKQLTLLANTCLKSIILRHFINVVYKNKHA